jgi:type I restriction enzyme S subunit
MSVVRSYFLNAVPASRDARDQIEIPARSTSAVNNINSDEVRTLEVPLPPLEEQDELVQSKRKTPTDENMPEFM